MADQVETILASDPAFRSRVRDGARQTYYWLRWGILLCAIAVITVFAGQMHAVPVGTVSAQVHATAPSLPTNAVAPVGVQGGRALPPTTAAAPPSPTGFGGAGDWWNPSTWIPDALSAAFKWLYDGIVTPLDQFIQWIFSLKLITTTDPTNTYANTGAVGTTWAVMETVAMSLLGVVVMWIGYSIMATGGIGTNYRTAREMLPRVILAGLAIHFSLYFAGFVIDLNNALCRISFDPANPTSPLTYLVTLWSPGNPDLLKGIFTIAFALCAFLLLIQEFCRLALINLLLVTSPLGLLCWLAPETQGWARLWSSTFVSAVLIQAVQLLVLALGGTFIHWAGVNAPDGLTALLIGLATLYTAFKVPGMFRSLGGGQAGNILQDTVGAAGDVLLTARFAALFG